MISLDVDSRAMAVVVAGLYGVFGSIVHYLYEVVRNENRTFSFALLMINGILGFFIGQVVDSFGRGLEIYATYQGGILMVSGFLVFKILDFIEKEGINIIRQKINK